MNAASTLRQTREAPLWRADRALAPSGPLAAGSEVIVAALAILALAASAAAAALLAPVALAAGAVAAWSSGPRHRAWLAARARVRSGG